MTIPTRTPVVPTRRIGRSLSAALLALLTAGPAFAQPVNAAKEGNAWVGLVVAIILALAVAVISFMSPKRGHQD